MNFTDLGPAMTQSQTRDDIAKLRSDIAFLAGMMPLDGDCSYPKEVLERILRIASGKP